jgi:hypothetical protein
MPEADPFVAAPGVPAMDVPVLVAIPPAGAPGCAAGVGPGAQLLGLPLDAGFCDVVLPVGVLLVAVPPAGALRVGVFDIPGDVVGSPGDVAG